MVNREQRRQQIDEVLRLFSQMNGDILAWRDMGGSCIRVSRRLKSMGRSYAPGETPPPISMVFTGALEPILDIYCPSLKWHDIRHNRRGKISGNLRREIYKLIENTLQNE